MASKAQYIIGVDTGGTFTDVVVLGQRRRSLDGQGLHHAG